MSFCRTIRSGWPVRRQVADADHPVVRRQVDREPRRRREAAGAVARVERQGCRPAGSGCPGRRRCSSGRCRSGSRGGSSRTPGSSSPGRPARGPGRSVITPPRGWPIRSGKPSPVMSPTAASPPIVPNPMARTCPRSEAAVPVAEPEHEVAGRLAGDHVAVAVAVPVADVEDQVRAPEAHAGVDRAPEVEGAGVDPGADGAAVDRDHVGGAVAGDVADRGARGRPRAGRRGRVAGRSVPSPLPGRT